MDIPIAYDAIRLRVTGLVAGLDPADEARRVPSCPDWDVHDLVAHMAAMPAALADGDLPSGDIQEWLDRIVADNRSTPVSEMLDRWARCAPRLSGVLASPLLAIDLMIHEHDLRGALDRPGERDQPEVAGLVPHILESLAGYLTEAGLGAIEVRPGPNQRWRSHDAEPGWVLEIEPWEASRALESRRSAEELRALPGSGDPEPFIAVLDSHLPLPRASLGEG